MVGASPAATGAPSRVAGARALLQTDETQRTRAWLYEQTLNVSSLHSGPPSSESGLSALAAAATAGVDIRLMPDQDRLRILGQLERHLQEHGFVDVNVRLRDAIRTARSPLDSPLATAVRQSARELLGGAEPISHAVVRGSGPLHLFTELATGGGLPATVMPPGTIRPDSGMHGPDENVRVGHYLDTVKLTLRTLELLGESGLVTEKTQEQG